MRKLQVAKSALSYHQFIILLSVIVEPGCSVNIVCDVGYPIYVNGTSRDSYSCGINKSFEEPVEIHSVTFIRTKKEFDGEIFEGRFIDEISFKNDTKTLPNGLADKFPNVVALTAAKINLKVIQLGNFEGLKNLEFLYLQINRIEDIANRTFSGVQKLKVLYLNDNLLKRISKEAFEGLSELDTLYLHQNQIEFIHLEAFTTNSRLKVVTMNNNPIFRFDVAAFIKLVPSSVINLNEFKAIKNQSEKFRFEIKSLKNLNNALEDERNNFSIINKEQAEKIKSLENDVIRSSNKADKCEENFKSCAEDASIRSETTEQPADSQPLKENSENPTTSNLTSCAICFLIFLVLDLFIALILTYNRLLKAKLIDFSYDNFQHT